MNSQLKICLLVLVAMLAVCCKPTPQPVKHLGKDNGVDSAMLMQIEFNTHMVELANNECLSYIQQDSTMSYAQDDFGFWYTKTIRQVSDSVQKGQKVPLHLQVYELNDTLLADVKASLQAGNSELPMAVNRSLAMMCVGEQMQIVAPWYVAYGTSGTELVKPYTNVKIILTVEQ